MRKYVTEMTHALVEKRLHPRCGFDRPVEVWRQGDCHSSGHGIRRPQLCRSRDISAGGIRLKTPHPLPLHSLVKLDFKTHEEQPVQIFAKVVWSTHADCGLKFYSFDGPLSV